MTGRPRRRTLGGVELLWRPDLGGKIVSLRRGEGRNWAARPLRPRQPIQPGSRWADNDCSGWDECFPNVAAPPGEPHLDHGEVWRLGWEPESGAAATGRVRTSRRHVFGRAITSPAAGDLTFSYAVRAPSTGEAPLTGGAWAWAQHALMDCTDDTIIRLPAPARIRIESAFTSGTTADGAAWLTGDGWLGERTSLRSARGHAAKVWFAPPLPAWIAVSAGRDSITWDLAASTTPHLGLWVNRGGWGHAELDQIAVEPAFGSSDDLATAVARGGAGPLLPPGGRFEWQVRIRLTP